MHALEASGISICKSSLVGATSQKTSHEDSQNANLFAPRELHLPYNWYWETENEEIACETDNALHYVQSCVEREMLYIYKRRTLDEHRSVPRSRDCDDCIGNEHSTIEQR